MGSVGVEQYGAIRASRRKPMALGHTAGWARCRSCATPP